MKKINVIIIIGAIVAIIGLCLPIIEGSNAGITAYGWGFGLVLTTEEILITFDTTNEIFAGMMGLGCLFIFLGPIIEERGKDSPKASGALSLAGGIITLLAPLVFMALNSEVLSYFTPSFGYYVPIVAGIIGIIGGIGLMTTD